MIARLGEASGLFATARRATRGSLRILCYHGLWTAPGAPYGECLFMGADRFEARMRWLAASRYPVLPLDEAVARLRTGTLPRHAVAITIDDGWVSTATHMAPILRRLGLPATLYVSTWYVEHRAPVLNVLVNFAIARIPAAALNLSGLLPGFPAPVTLDDAAARTALASRVNTAIDAVPDLAARVALAEAVAARAGVDLVPLGDQFRFMTPAQLAGIERMGIAVELHGHRHESVDAPGADLARDIADNRAAIARAGIARPACHFCFPRGDVLPGVETELERLGVVSATITRRGINPPGTSRYRLSRLLDGPRVSQAHFEAWLAGVYQPLDRLRR